ncbi:MAG TPA: hypothetical protein VII79_07630 [Candidatus Dormibacteraeota bacterium]
MARKATTKSTQRSAKRTSANGKTSKGLFIYAVIAGLFGVLASVFPSIRASRIDVLQAMTAE